MCLIAVDCGALPLVQHGHAVTNGTVFQSVANYTCDNGYNLVGIQSRTCESNATWSGNEPVCKGIRLWMIHSLFLRNHLGLFFNNLAVDCGNLSGVVNGMVETVATIFGSVANYSCDNGYELVGPSTRTCQANGSWSDIDPLCKGKIEKNYAIVRTMIICLAVDCGNVDPPSYGDVHAPETTFQAVATYSCISGYNLVGDSKRTCQANESWSGKFPKCNRELQ